MGVSPTNDRCHATDTQVWWIHNREAWLYVSHKKKHIFESAILKSIKMPFEVWNKKKIYATPYWITSASLWFEGARKRKSRVESVKKMETNLSFTTGSRAFGEHPSVSIRSPCREAIVQPAPPGARNTPRWESKIIPARSVIINKTRDAIASPRTWRAGVSISSVVRVLKEIQALSCLFIFSWVLFWSSVSPG